ncbi:MAG: LamG-like jellyroll fold domain-containing protein [Phycisphaeraceae bacterium]
MMTRTLLTLAVGGGALLAGNVAQATLVKHWTLDSTSGTYTEAVTGNSTITTDVGVVVSGLPGITPDGGNAVQFANDGTSHIAAGTVQDDGTYVAGVGDGTAMNVSNQYTFSAWFNTATTAGSDKIIASSRFNSNTGWMLGLRGASVIFDFGNTRFTTAFTVEAEKDYFVAVVGDASNGIDTVGGGTNRSRISLYDVDAGTWVSEDKSSFKNNLWLKEMTIGAFTNDINGREWDGIVDDVRIYDNALTTAELEALVGTTPSIPGDTDGDGDIDDSDLGTAFSNYTGPLAPGTGGKTAADGDTDGDGDVDDSDLGTAFSGYTGPLGPASVPEPTSLALVGLGGLALIRRRRA